MIKLNVVTMQLLYFLSPTSKSDLLTLLTRFVRVFFIILLLSALNIQLLDDYKEKRNDDDRFIIMQVDSYFMCTHIRTSIAGIGFQS
jgi:hypothetical protein